VIEALLQAERLLIHGMVDQAEQIYANAAERDPRNSIAVVGLARVALERGQDRLAYERACAALEIDPENAAALRLEARLSEVFATRGEDVQRPRFVAKDEQTMPPLVQATRQEAAGMAMPDAGPDALPSERIVFTRNPSMAEHQLMEDDRQQRQQETATDAGDEPGPSHATGAAPESNDRPSLLRRLFRDPGPR